MLKFVIGNDYSNKRRELSWVFKVIEEKNCQNFFPHKVEYDSVILLAIKAAMQSYPAK